MTLEAPEEPGPVRLLFEIAREDNPMLYDDLLRFRKGTKRVNRLRLLAHEGLMAIQAAGRAGSFNPAVASQAPVKALADRRLSQALITNDAFGWVDADVERD